MRKYYILFAKDFTKLVKSNHFLKLARKVNKVGYTWMHPLFYKLNILIDYMIKCLPKFLWFIPEFLRVQLTEIALWHKRKYFKDYVTLYIDF